MSDFRLGDRVRLTCRTFADDPFTTGDEGEVILVDVPTVRVRLDRGLIANFYRRHLQRVSPVSDTGGDGE